MRRVATSLVLAAGTAAPAFAQAAPAAPVVLSLPATPRVAALGQAWVAGRDQEVLFSNPAQLIGARQGLDLSLMRYGRNATHTSLGSIHAAGRWSLTLGWGVQFVDFTAPAAAAYPYATETLFARGDVDATSAAMAVGGGLVSNDFRIGAAGKYVTERLAMPPASAGVTPVSHGAVVADLGVARNIFGGVAAASVQNLGPRTLDDDERLVLPRQGLFGWSMVRPAGPLDLMLVGQVTVRDDWTGAGGGIETGYSWIDGYTVALRAGARRPEGATEHPWTIGAAVTGDRLTVEYGARFFEDGHTAHGVTVRWR